MSPLPKKKRYSAPEAELLFLLSGTDILNTSPGIMPPIEEDIDPDQGIWI